MLKWPLFKTLQSDLKKKQGAQLDASMHLHFKFCENPPNGFCDSASHFFSKKSKNIYHINSFDFREKKTFLQILIVLYVYCTC